MLQARSFRGRREVDRYIQNAPVAVAPRLRSIAAGEQGTSARRARCRIRPHAWFVAPVCFDASCQAAADAAFAAAIAVPLVAAAALGAWVLRPPPQELRESGRLFEDEQTGTLFEAPEGVAPELDKNSRLAFRPLSYTPWPVAADAPGERIRIPVGKVGSTEPRTFVFEKLLPGGSEVVSVSLPRPLGVVFEFDERRRRVVVAGFVPGGNGEQRQKVAKLNSDRVAQAALEGDILRAVTCTCPVWPTKALFGAVAPERHIVVYGLDAKTKWASVRTALRRGEFKDGPVTLVLERRRAGAAMESITESSGIPAVPRPAD